MNMGGPNDHWLTDLRSYNRPAFSTQCDALIKEILDLSGTWEFVDTELAARLDRLWHPRGANEASQQELRRVEVALRSLRDRLRADAVERGWELRE